MPKVTYEVQSSWDTDWVVVQKEIYLKIERQAGFISKVKGEPACGSFSIGNVSGRVRYD